MIDSWPLSDLFAIVALGVGGVLLGVARWTQRATLGRAVAGLLALGAVGAAVGGLSWWTWLAALVLVGGYAAAGVAAQRDERFAGVERLQAAVFLTAGPILALALVWRNLPALDDGGQPDPTVEGIAAGAPRLPDPVPTSAFAFTDTGRAVQLLTCPVRVAPDMVVSYHKHLATEGFPGAVQVGEPDPQSNCFGWIFTDGRYWVSHQDVDNILRDNHYAIVDEPQPGDLIIYRDERGAPAHAGIVRRADADGVEIESKWGSMFRLRHAPAEQPFSKKWDFYHTGRAAHALRVIDHREAVPRVQ